ncbi:Protein of unknown function, partial [Gryllus bimaculatus]
AGLRPEAIRRVALPDRVVVRGLEGAGDAALAGRVLQVQPFGLAALAEVPSQLLLGEDPMLGSSPTDSKPRIKYEFSAEGAAAAGVASADAATTASGLRVEGIKVEPGTLSCGGGAGGGGAGGGGGGGGGAGPGSAKVKAEPADPPEESYLLDCENIHIKTEVVDEALTVRPARRALCLVLPAQDVSAQPSNASAAYSQPCDTFRTHEEVQIVMTELKEDSDEDVFLSNVSGAPSAGGVGGGGGGAGAGAGGAGAAGLRAEPSPTCFASRLRGSALRKELARYTPPPMLDPRRRGTGLFWTQRRLDGR